MKQWKKAVLAAAMALALLLAGCGAGGEDAELVFVSGADTPIGSVVLSSASSEQGGQRADNSPMERNDYIGFSGVEYPVTVTVCSQVNGRGRLASCRIGEAPAEGERWYVIARDGADGMALEVTTEWPLDRREGRQIG